MVQTVLKVRVHVQTLKQKKYFTWARALGGLGQGLGPRPKSSRVWFQKQLELIVLQEHWFHRISKMGPRAGYKNVTDPVVQSFAV